MGLLRAFLASELPPSLQDAIQTATSDLHQTLGNDLIRWVPVHNIHLTLKFMGDVSPANLDLIKPMLTREAAQFPAFDVYVEGLGAYPTERRPRVLWVGLNAPSALASLQHALETAASQLGYEEEQRGFDPHLTIGRVRQNVSATDIQKIRASLEATRVGRLGAIHVDAIHLFKSDLQPTGPIYTKLFSAPLGNH